jgi:hypothetical protein
LSAGKELIMSDKQPMQAMPDDGLKGAPDGTNTRRSRHPSGESNGGSYANPQTGKEPTGGGGGFMGHGGQTHFAYHGTGQGGTDDDPEVGNVNAVTKED